MSSANINPSNFGEEKPTIPNFELIYFEINDFAFRFNWYD